MESMLEQLQNDKATQVGVAFALVAVVAGAAFLYFINRKKSTCAAIPPSLCLFHFLSFYSFSFVRVF
jgi:hypothetical protein